MKAVTWSAREREIVATSLYCARAMLPAEGDAWAAHVAANARAIVLADLESFAAMRENAVANAVERIAGLRTELDAARALHGERVPTQNAADRLDRHEKWAAKDAAKARSFRRLKTKIEAHGLPPTDEKIPPTP